MVRLEVFSGDPPCPGCVALVELAERVAARYQGELELTVFRGAEGLEKFEAYRLFCVPAALNRLPRDRIGSRPGPMAWPLLF